MTGTETVLVLWVGVLGAGLLGMFAQLRKTKAQLQRHIDYEKKRQERAHEDWTETREGGRLAELRAMQRWIDTRSEQARKRYEDAWRRS